MSCLVGMKIDAFFTFNHLLKPKTFFTTTKLNSRFTFQDHNQKQTSKFIIRSQVYLPSTHFSLKIFSSDWMSVYLRFLISSSNFKVTIIVFRLERRSVQFLLILGSRTLFGRRLMMKLPSGTRSSLAGTLADKLRLKLIKILIFYT